MTTLSDNQKLLALTLVIETIIKPSNQYYNQAITKIQRFWRRRSGYYGFTPLSEDIQNNTKNQLALSL